MDTFLLILKIALLLGVLFGLYVLGAILYGTITDYQPEEAIVLTEGNDGSDVDSSLTLYTWNIGYSGLGEESDFFYDGGEMVRAKKPIVEKNLAGIKEQISTWNDADFILLQEVDMNSKRSYGINQLTAIESASHLSHPQIGINYQVKYIPIPITKPMGRVKSGIVTLSKQEPSMATRHSFPGNYSWPKSLFFLDRCFVLQRHVHGDKELVVVNTHNSAYDDGTLKAAQMKYLRTFLIEEYEKGNYVIVGGDWNQCPPDYEIYKDMSQDDANGYVQTNINSDYIPEGWQWAYDASVHTNRKVAEVYMAGKTFTTVIDFFLLSPNVKLKSIQGLDTQFQFSDHQAVKIKVELD